MKHIYLDKSFFLFLIIIILTGSFNNFVLYFLLLIIHESGHTIMGLIFNYQIDKISFYPYGGVVTFNSEVNKPLYQDFLVLISGPLVQCLGYFLLSIFIKDNCLLIYHYSLLIFNLLPIYPLDGGKLVNIIFNYHFNYLNSFYLTFIISIILIVIGLIINIYHFNFNLFMMIIVLITKLITSYRNLDYYYQKFLLERYLYCYNFSKQSYITSIRKMYRDRKHIINLVEEKKVLNKFFKTRVK